MCYTLNMDEHQSLWLGWSHALHRWGISEGAASILEGAGSLSLLIAQLLSVSQGIIDETVARAIFANRKFVDVVLAPDATEAARAVFARHPDVRLLTNPALESPNLPTDLDVKRVRGGFLIQAPDTRILTAADLKVAGSDCAYADQVRDLLFAWSICRASKSNTITIAKDGMLLGLRESASRTESVVVSWRCQSHWGELRAPRRRLTRSSRSRTVRRCSSTLESPRSSSRAGRSGIRRRSTSATSVA